MAIAVPSDTPDFLDEFQGLVDNLLALATITYAGSPPRVAETFATNKSYQSVGISFTTGANSGTYTFILTVKDALGNQLYQQAYSRGCPSGFVQQFLFPAPCVAGGQLVIVFQGPSGSTTSQAAVYGSLSPMGSTGQLYRPDARPYPTGGSGADGTNTAGGTLIVAPGAGRRIMLASLAMLIQSPAAGNAYSQVIAEVGGVNIKVGEVGCGNGSVATGVGAIPPWGILCDENTAVTYNQAGTPGTLDHSATYDIGP